MPRPPAPGRAGARCGTCQSLAWSSSFILKMPMCKPHTDVIFIQPSEGASVKWVFVILNVIAAAGVLWGGMAICAIHRVHSYSTYVSLVDRGAIVEWRKW